MKDNKKNKINNNSTLLAKRGTRKFPTNMILPRERRERGNHASINEYKWNIIEHDIEIN